MVRWCDCDQGFFEYDCEVQDVDDWFVDDYVDDEQGEFDSVGEYIEYQSGVVWMILVCVDCCYVVCIVVIEVVFYFIEEVLFLFRKWYFWFFYGWVYLLLLIC